MHSTSVYVINFAAPSLLEPPRREGWQKPPDCSEFTEHFRVWQRCVVFILLCSKYIQQLIGDSVKSSFPVSRARADYTNTCTHQSRSQAGMCMDSRSRRVTWGSLGPRLPTRMREQNYINANAREQTRDIERDIERDREER